MVWLAMAHADAGRRRAAASDSGGATLCEIDAAANFAAAPRCEEPRIRVGSFERESSQFESLQFEDEESKVHLELRADDSESSGFALVLVSFAITQHRCDASVCHTGLLCHMSVPRAINITCVSPVCFVC